MKRIIISGPIIKYPWGGLIQYWLAWLVGLKKLGHDVYYVEDVEWDFACYDVQKRIMTNNPTYGIKVVKAELDRYQLGDRWCFLNSDGECYGLTKKQLKELFKTTDIFIDLEYDSLNRYSLDVPLRVYVDGEPGWNQLGIQKLLDEGKEIPKYDVHCTLGLNIGTEKSNAPDLGINWEHIYCPVLLDSPIEFDVPANAAFSTVMKWKANPTLEYKGKKYGMKDQELQKFVRLPQLVDQTLEIAVSGPNVPKEMLRKNGWIVKNADDISTSVDNYRNYIASSKGEFSIAKNAFVETNCGCFLERSGYYMFSNRPVVLQDTGWSDHLPTGRGLFAVRNLQDAIEAIKTINIDYKQHAKWAREIVHEYLDAEKVLRNFMNRLDNYI